MRSRFLGALLLISGTTIGAGMLALPITTGLAGFVPALLIMLFIWLFMMLTAYYLLEINLKIVGPSNLISMMGKTLGTTGQAISWVIYLLLLYSLLAAYMVGCSEILGDLIALPQRVWTLIIFLIFALFVYFGTLFIDWLNRFLMTGLVIAYLVMIALGSHKVQPQLLLHSNWRYLLSSLSVVVTTFGYHIIIPTLTVYLDHNVHKIKWAIFWGSLIPFIFYVLWQLFVMGVIPTTGEASLQTAYSNHIQIAVYLQKFIGSPWVLTAISAFSFFAIMTSLIGVSLSLHDFLLDGLKIKQSQFGKLLIVLLTFFPPLFFTLFYPHGFIAALQYAGIFVVLLLILLPALMVWRERYSQKTNQFPIISAFKVWGGKPLLIITILLSLILLAIECFT